MERCGSEKVDAGHLCKETSYGKSELPLLAQAQRGPSRGKSLIGAMLIASAIALVLIVYARQPNRSPSAIESQLTSSQATGSSKRGKSPPAQPQQEASRPQTPQSQQQTSPQGGTGPLETSSGGAPGGEIRRERHLPECNHRRGDPRRKIRSPTRVELSRWAAGVADVAKRRKELRDAVFPVSNLLGALALLFRFDRG